MESEFILAAMAWWKNYIGTNLSAGFSYWRVGHSCMSKGSTPGAVLDCWLKANPKVSNRIEWKSPGAPVLSWKDWPFALKSQLHHHFWHAFTWYHQKMPAAGPKPFSMPRPQTIPGDPDIWFGFCMAEGVARNIYLSHVANSLAAELRGVFPWSITGYTEQNLSLLFAFSEFFSCQEAPKTKFPGYYPQSHTLPATPYYAAHFFKAKSLLGLYPRATVAWLFGWCRNLSHAWAEPNTGQADWTCFWGPGSPPIGASQLIDGTTYTGKLVSPPKTFGHFTIGCSGTTQFMKSVLRAVNIPVEARFGGNHHMPFFPTLDRALSHGDDPYSRSGDMSAFPGWPIPGKEEYLITGAQWDQWFGPGVAPATAASNVGRHIADLAIKYQSDYLLAL
ncbi:MAG TPA: hypothetical protein VEX43_04060, partial [Chthoniobacterales bacterium]|nr:hypothetical protein [Chthoniobacterales bacterium]